MSRERMPARRYSPSEVLARLATLHHLTHEDGSPNWSAMSRRTGIPTPTLSRIARGARAGDDAAGDRDERAAAWILSASTVRRLMSAFGLTFAEASREAEIPTGTAERKARSRARTDAIGPVERALLAALRELAPADRREVSAFVDAKRALRRRPPLARASVSDSRAHEHGQALAARIALCAAGPHFARRRARPQCVAARPVDVAARRPLARWR